jgi:dUTP pyrophosphatase
MKAKIHRLDPEIELPKYQTGESAGFDIAAAEQAVVKPGQAVLIKTGLIIQAPEGHFLLLNSRSSLGIKKGLIAMSGIVDRDYCGPTDEIKIQIYNFSGKDVEIEKGERLVQGLFLPVDQAEWQELRIIEEQSRGGFGSSGGYK